MFGFMDVVLAMDVIGITFQFIMLVLLIVNHFRVEDLEDDIEDIDGDIEGLSKNNNEKRGISSKQKSE